MGGRLGSGVRLRKCPFCGGSVSLYQMNEEGWWWYYIATGHNEKTRCRCRVFMESKRYSDLACDKERDEIKIALIENWNRRYVKCAGLQGGLLI